MLRMTDNQGQRFTLLPLFVSVVLILCFSIGIRAQASIVDVLENPLKQFDVLQATRADIENILGYPNEKECDSCLYDTKNGVIAVSYAIEPCKGEKNGWNVGRGTVLSYSFTPKEPRTYKELGLLASNFIRTSDDTFRRYYTNPIKGLQLIFRPIDELESWRFIPKRSDSYLRCKEFPPYDPVSETYYPYDTIRKTNFTVAAGVIDVLSIELEAVFNDRLAYMVMYSGDNISAKEFNDYAQKLKRYVKKKGQVKNIKIVNGVKRSSFAIEIFVLPKDYFPPTPVIE